MLSFFNTPILLTLGAKYLLLATSKSGKLTSWGSLVVEIPMNLPYIFAPSNPSVVVFTNDFGNHLWTLVDHRGTPQDPFQTCSWQHQYLGQIGAGVFPGGAPGTWVVTWGCGPVRDVSICFRMFCSRWYFLVWPKKRVANESVSNTHVYIL